MDYLTPERTEKYQRVISKRQEGLTVILENVHDPHNIGAVIRSCDAVGISEIYVIYSEASANLLKKEIGKNSSSGARKYVKVHFYDDLNKCIAAVRMNYDLIMGTHLSEAAKSLYDIDFTTSVALMFGNEKDGLTHEALTILDGNFIIPQYGMVQSLNISVACAVSVFEASRQRKVAGLYADDYDDNNPKHAFLMERFRDEHRKSIQSNKYLMNRDRM